MKETLAKIRGVLGRPFYLFFGASVAVASFLFYSLILNRSIINTYISEGNFSLLTALIPDLVTGFARSSTFLSLLLTGLTSAMIGLNFTLAIFRLRDSTQLDKTNAGSIPGILVSIVAPACPACATTFLAFAGVTSLYGLLPFKGLSFQFLALLLLGWSAYYTAKQINRDKCTV